MMLPPRLGREVARGSCLTGIYTRFLHHSWFCQKLCHSKRKTLGPLGCSPSCAKRSTFENGPHDKLWKYCFGSEFTFYVAPQNSFASNSRDAVDFRVIVLLVVFNSDDKPVLVVEGKTVGLRKLNYVFV